MLRRDPLQAMLDEVSFSSTAKRLGIDNSVPPEFRTRALGLAQIRRELQAVGIRVTSAFRRRELTAAIRAGLKPGETVPALPGPGSHDEARALDVAPSDGNSLAQLQLLETKIRAHPLVSSTVTKFVLEGAGTRNAHVHVQFKTDRLEQIGQNIETRKDPFA